ncbi:DUF6547 family protein [Dyella nitratireducens]|uniref:Uncharacterized protein n=1 Tax=Dyella nitratireducens TaxID=1849580 RepID=A0ABQ1FK48_9GAMM|nr:DUF6547 family protein [Dyella nitratireducens]GGA19513.1 hypothetical protein GCM10010981_04400 [Dyella nitratireducens]GLQ44499.1 hypothetical protein GCM10007902_43490 [Dyella nitratireducens]
MPSANDPAATYKAIIDQLVDETRLRSVLAERAHENRPFPLASGWSNFNELLSSLTEHQRNLMSEVLRAERVSAIHDVLALFSWWIESQGVGLSLDGEPMPVDFSGEGLHGDFIGRCGDWAWPDDTA